MLVSPSTGHSTLSIIAWLFILNFMYGVDALIWSDNMNIVIPVWCDITSKIIIGSTFSLPAACLCLCIHIKHVASVNQGKTLLSNKWTRQLFELFMCFGLPMISMGLHYIVQGHRFDIIKGYGCHPATYVSIPAIFLIWVPPLTLSNGLMTFCYFCSPAMDVHPWTNWDDVHWNFLRIDLYPAAFMPKIIATNYYITWWIIPTSTFILVVFFAFGKDAVNEYMACMMWICRNVLKRTNK
ncbi:pheromone A receptor-domain-containing protein [Suillus bovinus]|uniref:pheromone A receptor-domain-containing protein n=1 Tax=Suillus bovinus TaxID=48563 RepID=UPI001B87ED2B|nr:pheromone A receptor-domain-containing protein [Suillus bovinus]KAG2151131.1 pheromone A receptor-domain-containing protein [Suillus bovinus]